MVMLRDPELYEAPTREDVYDLQREVAEQAARIDALAEAVRILGRDQYRPLPAGNLSDAISRAERRRLMESF